MKLKTFTHGIHPPEHKQRTEEKKIVPFTSPEKVVIPLNQHFGKPAEPIVNKGDEVLLGQRIGESTAFCSAHIHSSVSGKVLSVDTYYHPVCDSSLAVTIKNDGEDRLSPERKGYKDPFSLPPEKIQNAIKEAGIVGLGGAAFPTAIKLAPPKDKPVDTLIINGCECEPVLTSDYRLMLEHPDDILKGAELARIASGAKRIIVGIEDNKKKAYDHLKEKAKTIPAEIALLKTKYPQGAEKNLIHALLKKEVPRGGLPFDVGVVVQNVGTAKSIWDALSEGKPLYERVITVSGNGINNPKNILIRLGTPFQDAIDFCEGITEDANIIVMGGPMMGIAQWTLEAPVIKGTSGILVWEAEPSKQEYSCIKCGRCVEHCPMRLSPTQLAKYAQFDKLAEAEAWGILDCVECGCCQYSCPSKIPLVHWIRLGKNKVACLKRKNNAR